MDVHDEGQCMGHFFHKAGFMVSKFYDILLRMRYMRYFMTFWCISFMRFLMMGLEMFFKFAIDCSSMMPPNHVVIVLGGLTFHPMFKFVYC